MACANILTAKEAAAYLRIKKHTLYSLIREGIIPAARIGHRWRFTRHELDEYTGATPSPTFEGAK